MATYDSLAALIGSFPEVAAFRNFGDLPATVLLMKQPKSCISWKKFKMSAELDVHGILTVDAAVSSEKMNAAQTKTGGQRKKRLMTLVQS